MCAGHGLLPAATTPPATHILHANGKRKLSRFLADEH